jgi:uncharacterized repeat protein (TIGR01451 family)
MSDWAVVLADPDNVRLDGPGGGLPDADAPADAALDISAFAFTWDGTYLYLYLRREARATTIRYFWFFIDADDDGLMESGEPVMRVRWRGSNGHTSTRHDRYLAAGAGGDPSSAGGVHDGYTVPGTTSNGPAMENTTGGSSSGLEMEARYSWATMGLLPGSPVDIHVSATSTQSAFPSGVNDNAGRTNYFSVVTLLPDRAASTTPGTTAVFAHTLTNNGNVAERFNLGWSSTGSFTPSGVSFYRDADGSGTVTPGDLLLTDTDGDGNPDTSPVAAAGGTLALLAAVVTPPAGPVRASAAVTLTATSSLDPAASGQATDTVTLGGPSLTLVKVVDSATVSPGGILNYTVTYTNTGTEDAQNVVVEDMVPAPALYVAGSATGAGATVSFSHDGGGTFDPSEAPPVTHLRWTLSVPLPPAGSGTVLFSVLVP